MPSKACLFGFMSRLDGCHKFFGPEVCNFQSKIFGSKLPKSKILLCNVGMENKSYSVNFLLMCTKKGRYVQGVQ